MSKPINKTLLSLARNLGVVFVLVVPFSLLFFSMGYDRELIIAFSIANLLIWTDGFLTVYALEKGAREINPLMNVLSKITNRKTFLLVSRFAGSSLTLYGIIEKNLIFLLLLSWIFSIGICLNLMTLSHKNFLSRKRSKTPSPPRTRNATKSKTTNSASPQQTKGLNKGGY